MNSKNKIITGLVIFILFVSFPLWINLIREKSSKIELELTDKAKLSEKCILPKNVMVSEHMHILDLWRHSVVRNETRLFVSPDGREFNMSLSDTCLDCHSNKIEFCDRCHNYLSVKPYCWECHIDDISIKERINEME